MINLAKGIFRYSHSMDIDNGSTSCVRGHSADAGPPGRSTSRMIYSTTALDSRNDTICVRIPRALYD